MALSFNDTKGAAQKDKLPQYKYEMGQNRVRIFGDILPRYVYWITGENNKDIPFECLSFDRDKEVFNNLEKDWVREFFPDKKCGWAYACLGISDGKVVVVNLKKKLWEQIKVAAEDLGDPTDVENGWDIVFKREKTGPLAYNVEYTLQALKCKNRALTEEERELISEFGSMDDVLPRPTADAQKALLDRIVNGADESEQPEEDIDKEFSVSDDSNFEDEEGFDK